MSEIDQIRINTESYLILAAASALPAFVLWFTRMRGRTLFPPLRQRLVPWSGFEICLLVFFLMVFWPTLIYETLSRSGFLSWFYGSDVNASPGTALWELMHDRRLLWMTVAAAPFEVATVMVLLRTLSKTRSYQLGLSTHRFAQNVFLGWTGWCLLTPLVLSCHILAEWAFRAGLGYHSDKHPLQRIIEAGPHPDEWVLIIISAVVVAPVLEELLFRGVLQVWFARRNWGGYIAMMAAFLFTLLTRWEDLARSWKDRKYFGHTALVRELMPLVFVLAMVPVCLLLERAMRKRMVNPQEVAAIYGTALLFAMSHSNVWPTPIPLFLLGLGLGYLAYRTQSLVGPILFHALFNAVACVGFMLM